MKTRRVVKTCIFLGVASLFIVNIGRLTDTEDHFTTISNRSKKQSHRIKHLNCLKVLNGDEDEISKFKGKLPESLPNDFTIMNHTKNCDTFRQMYGYNNIKNTREEKDFPLAFNILFYKEVAQVEMLLRSIYRTQNSYCLHVDGFAPNHVHEAAKSLAGCFPNVFIVSKTENIVYKSFQRLKADINCMKDHLKLETSWKYLMNIPGEEYTLKTNLETVRILKALNNTNSIECHKNDNYMKFRYYHKFVYNYSSNGHYTISKTKDKNPLPPHNMEIIKGSAYGVFTRAFVHYIVYNQTAKDLLKWCQTVLSPDEYFWHTLQHNPHLEVPGRIPGGICSRKILATFVNWGDLKCHGRFLRGICVLNLGDLKIMKTMKGITANKFKFKESYAALQCLEEWIINKTRSEQTVDSNAYRKWLSLDKISTK